jgi:hypothetical protein
LKHGLAAGKFYEGAWGEGLDLLLDLVEGEGLASGERVLGVAPCAAKIAAGDAYEDAGQSCEGGFSLDGFVELDEVHGLFQTEERLQLR